MQRHLRFDTRLAGKIPTHRPWHRLGFACVPLSRSRERQHDQRSSTTGREWAQL